MQERKFVEKAIILLKRIIRKVKPFLPHFVRKEYIDKRFESINLHISEIEEVQRENTRLILKASSEAVSLIENVSHQLEDNASAANHSISTSLNQLNGIAASIKEISDVQFSTRSDLEKASQDIQTLLLSSQSLQRSMLDKLKYSNIEYLQDAWNNRRTERRILVAGWYGASNLGDELMLQSLLAELSEEQLQRTTVLIWDDTNYDTNFLPKSVSLIHYPASTWEIAFLVDSFDTLVWGGGAIIDDRQYDNNPTNFSTGNLFIRLSAEMIRHGKDVYALGLSCNDHFENEAYIKKLRLIIASCKVFALRDPLSVDVLIKAGIDGSFLTRCEDLVLGNKSIPVAKNLAQINIGVTLMCFEEYDQYNEQILSAVLNFSQKHLSNTSIILIPFYNFEDTDTRYYESLLNRIGKPAQISISTYSSDTKKLAISNCSFNICCRYHAALLSGMMEIPFLTICPDSHPHYKNKMVYISELFDNKEHLIMMSSEKFKESLSASIKHAYARSHPKWEKTSTECQQKWLKSHIANI